MLFLSFQFISAQEIMIQKGVVVDALPVNDSIKETYSVYLPQNFTSDKAWPVLFIFDSNGRGRQALQLFRKAAEEQGYIMAASNDIAEDNSLLENTKVAARMINRVYGYFPVNSREMYTAGFAEGARVASALKAVYKDVQGVLAAGDTWVNANLVMNNSDFGFVGLSGTRDYRVHILGETVDFLKQADLDASLYTFEGGQEWPNPEILSHAVGRFTLRAMNKGLRPMDPALVETLYQQELETVEQLRRQMKYYKAHQWLEKMEPYYAPFNKKSDLRQRKKEISREKLFRQQRRSYNRAANKEAEYRDQYVYFLNEDVYAANFENLGWWNQQLKELEEMQQGSNPAEQEMAYRLQGLLRSYAENTFNELQEANAAIDPLIFTAILRTIFDKQNPEGYRSIISLSAQDGDYYTALLYLEDLLKTGYKDMEALYNIPGTLDLKLSPEYNALIKKYLGESKFYND